MPPAPAAAPPPATGRCSHRSAGPERGAVAHSLEVVGAVARGLRDARGPWGGRGGLSALRGAMVMIPLTPRIDRPAPRRTMTAPPTASHAVAGIV